MPRPKNPTITELMKTIESLRTRIERIEKAIGRPLRRPV